MSLSRNQLYPIAIFLLLPFLIHWRLFWPIDTAYIGNDFLYHWYIFFSQSKQVISGGIPYFDSGPFFGLPLLERPDTLFLYPPVAGFIFLISFLKCSPGISLQLFEVWTMLHLSLAGIGAYILARNLELNKRISVFVGILYMFNGSLIAFMNASINLIAQAWLPIIFLAYTYLTRKPSIKTCLLFSLSITPLLQAFAWQNLIYTFIFLGVWGLVERGSNRKKLITLGYWTIAAIGISLLMSLPVVISGLQVPKISTRADLTYGLSGISGSVRPRQLIDFFLPYLSAKNFGERELVEVYPDTLPYFYIGILPLLLIIPAFMRKDKRNIFLLGGFVITTLFTLGLITPVFDFFYTSLFPVMKPFRNIAKAEYIGLLCVALLAGRGLQNLADHYEETKENILNYRKYLSFGLVALLALTLLLATKLDQLLWSYPAGPITIGYFTILNVLVLFLILFSSALGLFYSRERLSNKSFVILAIFLVILDLGMFAKNYPINFWGKDPTNFATSNEITRKLESDTDKPYRVDVSLFPHNYAPSISGVRHVDGYLVYYPKNQLNFYQTLHLTPRNKTADRIAALRYVVSTEDLSNTGYPLKDIVTVDTNNQKSIYIHAQTPSGWVMAPIGTKFGIYGVPNPLPFA